MKDAPSHRRKGVGYVLLAAGLFSLSTPLAKPLLGVISSQLLAGLLYFGSGLGTPLLAIMTPKNIISKESSLTRTDTPWMLGTIVSGGVLAPLLLLNGLQHVSASSASLLLNLEGLFTVLLAWLVFQEQIDHRFTFGAAAILLGSVLISWHGFEAIVDITGSLAIVGACFCWGLDNNFIRKISHRNPSQVACIRGLVPGTVNLSLGLWLLSNWPMLWLFAGLMIGIVSYGFSGVFWVLALRYLGSARAGAYFSSAPFIGAIVSLTLLREQITTYFVVASFAMAIGVWLLSTEKADQLKPVEKKNEKP
jgi:drug/metabolite transporter (DMT)-like permease